jgi:hypothetical protein
MTHEAGAGPKVKKTEMMRPNDACALLSAFEVPTDAQIPRRISRKVLKAEPQR